MATTTRKPAARKATAPATTDNGSGFSFEETDAVVHSAGVGRSESQLTLDIRQAVELAASTRKTYKTAEVWGQPDKNGNPAMATDHGRAVLATLQREGRRAGVSIRVGSDDPSGKKVVGSRMIYAAVDQIKRERKDKN